MTDPSPRDLLEQADRPAVLTSRLRDLARSIEGKECLVSVFAKDAWAPELWDALERIHERRKVLARELREVADGVEAKGRPAPLSHIHSLIERISWCEQEETELFLRAFWLDIGTLD